MPEDTTGELLALLAEYEGKKLAAFVFELAALLSEREPHKGPWPRGAGDPGDPGGPGGPGGPG